MSGYDLFTNTMIGVATTLVLSCGVACCCRFRRSEGTPLPPDTVVQPTAPPAPPMIYYPNAPQRYVVYMPQQNYYPQVQPSAFQPYPSQTQPYPSQTQPYPSQTQPTYSATSSSGPY
jgi:hypothetical protein